MGLPLASDVFGWDEEDVDPTYRPIIPTVPGGPCDHCPHAYHMGPCEMEVDVQGVMTDCRCFTARGMMMDKRVLRWSDADQQRDIEALKRRQWR